MEEIIGVRDAMSNIDDIGWRCMVCFCVECVLVCGLSKIFLVHHENDKTLTTNEPWHDDEQFMEEERQNETKKKKTR